MRVSLWGIIFNWVSHDPSPNLSILYQFHLSLLNLVLDKIVLDVVAVCHLTLFETAVLHAVAHKLRIDEGDLSIQLACARDGNCNLSPFRRRWSSDLPAFLTAQQLQCPLLLDDQSALRLRHNNRQKGNDGRGQWRPLLNEVKPKTLNPEIPRPCRHCNRNSRNQRQQNIEVMFELKVWV